MAVTQTLANTGLTVPGTTNPDMTNTNDTIYLLTEAFIQLVDGVVFGLQTDTGTANAYAVAIAGISLFTGLEFNFKAVHANTGASTLALNGGSAKAITKNGTTALSGSEISANQIVKVVYDGTEFQLISQ